MEKSAKTIGRYKFTKLSARQQHKILARLAEQALVERDNPAFFKRYDQLHEWAALDRFRPPAWLSESEIISECYAFHQGLAQTTPTLDATAAAPRVWRGDLPIEVVLDQVRTPFNVGSILRLIDNFALAGLVHADSHFRLDHPQVRRSARGCQAWVPVRYEADLPAWLQQAGVPVIGLELGADSTPLHQWRPPPAFKLVLGNESYGISQAVAACCQQTVAVPMWGYKHAMNVSHALAVTAYHCRVAVRPGE